MDAPTHSGSLFSWNGKVGTVEASDLPEPFSGRLFADAADEGFFVVSQKTGVKKAFMFVKRDETLCNEIKSWTFESSDGLKVIVFND